MPILKYMPIFGSANGCDFRKRNRKQRDIYKLMLSFSWDFCFGKRPGCRLCVLGFLGFADKSLPKEKTILNG